jgi:aspartate racemase
MKTIGVLGGIGPQATIDFEARVHAAAQACIPPRFNEGYPPMVTVYMRHAPVRVKDGLPVKPLELDPRILEAASKLGCWADLIVIPSNTPHFFLEDIAREAGRPVLSMVDVTLRELSRRGALPVGLVGLGIPQVYVQRFDAEKIPYCVASPALREKLDDAILRLMEGRADDRARRAATAAVAEVRDQGAAVTVLGCTEIPLLMGDAAEATDLVNPSGLLARAAVELALT